MRLLKEWYDSGFADESDYETYRTDLTDELLEDQHDWLTKDCFVLIERMIGYYMDDDPFSITRLCNIFRRELPGYNLIDIIEDNVGVDNLYNMLALILAALNYKILKIIDTKSAFKPIFIVSLEKEKLEAKWHEFIPLQTLPPDVDKRFKTVYITA